MEGIKETRISPGVLTIYEKDSITSKHNLTVDADTIEDTDGML